MNPTELDTELQKLIGSEGTVDLEGLKVPVVILNARRAYGRIDVLVSPSGTWDNTKWISAKRTTWKG